jgi:hypothetical protein
VVIPTSISCGEPGPREIPEVTHGLSLADGVVIAGAGAAGVGGDRSGE